uniref:Uncharacterized protein n=1 Tax=Amphimedon queenslandica TaxID=400682 RepID=A0A1X7V1Y0_AMPQE
MNIIKWYIKAVTDLGSNKNNSTGTFLLCFCSYAVDFNCSFHNTYMYSSYTCTLTIR